MHYIAQCGLSALQFLILPVREVIFRELHLRGMHSQRHSEIFYWVKVGSHLFSHSEFDYTELHSNVVVTVCFHWLLKRKRVSNLEAYLLCYSVSDMEIGEINITIVQYHICKYIV